MWRGEVRRGRAGQAFAFGEPGVLDGATAKSLAAGRHGPRQVGQIDKTKPLGRSCWRILDQSLEPREPALQATGRFNSLTIAGLSQGWAGLSPTDHGQCHSRPIETTSGLRLLMSQWHSSRGAQCRSGSYSVQHHARAHGHKAFEIPNGQKNQGPLMPFSQQCAFCVQGRTGFEETPIGPMIAVHGHLSERCFGRSDEWH